MSWILKLYETYNNCQSQIGYSSVEGERPLLPICHTSIKAHIEIVINSNGEFRRANLITSENDRTTIIPCTEDSAGRTSNIKAHPLCDKLQYIAGDFVGKHSKKAGKHFQAYIQTLTDWCQSQYNHPKAVAVLNYVSKQAVIHDLAAQGILFTNSSGKLLAKKDVERDRNVVDIFSIVQEGQEKSFIRWIVEDQDSLETRVWRDKTLWESWIAYYLSSKEKEAVCYVTGRESILTTNHPKYIRREGDSAKLISANDTTGFTFRGRFTDNAQACNVSLEVSQKAHYALAWLIGRQGFRAGDLAVVAWSSSGKPVPQPSVRSTDLFDLDELKVDREEAYTAQTFARKLTQKMRGYSAELGKTADIQIIALDSASKGRLAITYYRELTGSEYLQRIEHWHSSCSWIHDFGYDREKGRFYRFVGAPSPFDITEAAYGKNVDDTLRKATISRILPCIIDGQPIPRDLVLSTAHRATKRVSLEYGEWRKALSVACSLYKKYHEKECYQMTLETDRKTRDYLYGRLLALADDLENWAQSSAGEKRPTNATRLMQRFAERPFTTWRTIELALVPYRTRLGSKASKLLKTIDEVMADFDPDDFVSDKPLSGEFLLGYHAQIEDRRKAFSQAIPDNDQEENKQDGN